MLSDFIVEYSDFAESARNKGNQNRSRQVYGRSQ
jgi:hypothetical protein